VGIVVGARESRVHGEGPKPVGVSERHSRMLTPEASLWMSVNPQRNLVDGQNRLKLTGSMTCTICSITMTGYEPLRHTFGTMREVKPHDPRVHLGSGR
jgi:hypothetical protein